VLQFIIKGEMVMQDPAFDLVVEIRRTHTPATASTSDCISSLLRLRQIFGSIISSSHPDSGAGLALLMSSISAFSEGDSLGLSDIWLDGWGR
jgi:hypothetical protein